MHLLKMHLFVRYILYKHYAFAEGALIRTLYNV